MIFNIFSCTYVLSLKLGMVAHMCNAAFERRRQEDLEFKTNMNHLESPCL